MGQSTKFNEVLQNPRESRLNVNLFFRFLYLGLGVKRWLVLGLTGFSVCSVGLAVVLKNIFSITLPDFLPWYLEGVSVLIAGVFLVLLGIYGLYRSVGPLVFEAIGIDDLTNTIYLRRLRGRGPRIVAIGGGTGLSVLLRGLKTYTDNLTAIVTVADDGGSSGRLRRDFGVLPPGDFRNCLVAMSDDASLLKDLFKYRFDQGVGLEGHSFGNLFIAAMTEITGSFEEALKESSRILAVQGDILPSTIQDLILSAHLSDGSVVRGESEITKSGGVIEKVVLDPDYPEAYSGSVQAIRQADLIVIGPGSLYTSILPNLLVPGIAESICTSDSDKVYICNVATQVGETEGYTVSDHVGVLMSHVDSLSIDYVIANREPIEFGSSFLGEPVLLKQGDIGGAKLILGGLVDLDHPVRHDSEKLAQTVIGLHRK